MKYSQEIERYLKWRYGKEDENGERRLVGIR